MGFNTTFSQLHQQTLCKHRDLEALWRTCGNLIDSRAQMVGDYGWQKGETSAANYSAGY